MANTVMTVVAWVCTVCCAPKRIKDSKHCVSCRNTEFQETGIAIRAPKRTKKHCKRCNALVWKGDRYCHMCGEPNPLLRQVCCNCEAPKLTHDSKYCTNCGQDKAGFRDDWLHAKEEVSSYDAKCEACGIGICLSYRYCYRCGAKNPAFKEEKKGNQY